MMNLFNSYFYPSLFVKFSLKSKTKIILLTINWIILSGITGYLLWDYINNTTEVLKAVVNRNDLGPNCLNTFSSQVQINTQTGSLTRSVNWYNYSCNYDSYQLVTNTKTNPIIQFLQNETDVSVEATTQFNLNINYYLNNILVGSNNCQYTYVSLDYVSSDFNLGYTYSPWREGNNLYIDILSIGPQSDIQNISCGVNSCFALGTQCRATTPSCLVQKTNQQNLYNYVTTITRTNYYVIDVLTPCQYDDCAITILESAPYVCSFKNRVAWYIFAGSLLSVLATVLAILKYIDNHISRLLKDDDFNKSDEVIELSNVRKLSNLTSVSKIGEIDK